jgi:hypothetical protein
MTPVELLAILLSAGVGCLLAWIETGRDADFPATAVGLLAATFVGGAIALAIP